MIFFTLMLVMKSLQMLRSRPFEPSPPPPRHRIHCAIVIVHFTAIYAILVSNAMQITKDTYNHFIPMTVHIHVTFANIVQKGSLLSKYTYQLTSLALFFAITQIAMSYAAKYLNLLLTFEHILVKDHLLVTNVNTVPLRVLISLLTSELIITKRHFLAINVGTVAIKSLNLLNTRKHIKNRMPNSKI